MLLEFFIPYLSLCHLASWGLAQNLEGLGLFKYLNSQPMQVNDSIVYPMNLNPAVGVANLAVVLTGALAIVFMLNIRACFYLDKRIGYLGLTFWVLPGFLGVLGLMPDVHGMGPDVFRFGNGFPGGVESAAANLFICLLGGWSLILLVSSFWKKDAFKNAYDHVWYTLGLIAALYFVVDAGLPSYRDDLAATNVRMARTLQLFRTASNNLEVLCVSPKALRLAPTLCSMAPELKWRVISDVEMEIKVRTKVESPTWAAKLAADPVLASEIEALNNWACAQRQRPEQCQRTPIETALSSRDLDTPVVFPSPIYAEAIQKFHTSMEKTERRIHDIKQAHNIRYFGFLVVAFLAGGKLANASRAMVKVDPGRPHSWVILIVKLTCKTTMTLLKRFLALSMDAYFCIRSRGLPSVRPQSRGCNPRGQT